MEPSIASGLREGSIIVNNTRFEKGVCSLCIVMTVCVLFFVPAQAKTKTKCAICHHYYVKEGSDYCHSHTCHWRGKSTVTCNEGIYKGKYCTKHICKEYKCDEPVYFDTDVQACRYHQKKYEALEGSSKSNSASSTGKTCKYSGCRSYGVSYKKGYCNKHYKKLYETRDNFYDEDPESFYQDNKSTYKSRSEAYDDWEDEYEDG